MENVFSAVQGLFPAVQGLCTAYVAITLGRNAFERVHQLSMGVPLFINSENPMWVPRTDEDASHWPTRGLGQYRAALERQQWFEEVHQMSGSRASASDRVSVHDLTRGDFLGVVRRKQPPSGWGWFYG